MVSTCFPKASTDKLNPLNTHFWFLLYTQSVVHMTDKVFVSFLDNLNFQVGMAHFTEDQHDCIMDALMAMFCYKHIKV